MTTEELLATACRKELADSLEDWLLFSVRQGATEAEALENIRSAIQEYLEAVYDSLKSERVREVEVAV
jgi:predicted RNase H-like HicB family nuclease